MGLFGSLSVGTSGLSAAQLALDVTGQNISNANTEGYSRKRVSVVADFRKDGVMGQMGSGVNATSVERYRNEFIDVQIQSQVGEKGYYRQLDQAYERIENIFNEPSDTGLNEFLDNFWDSMHDLSNNPADLSSRELVAANTSALTTRFKAVADELGALRSSVDNNLIAHVETVNALTQRISSFNNQIAAVEIGEKFNANDARDQRDEAVKELAKEIPIEMIEDASGRISITSNGSILVGPSDRVELSMYRDTIQLDDGTESSELLIRFGNLSVQFKPERGEIGGLFAVRDEVLKEYEDTLDQFAHDLVKAVNEVHYEGYSLNQDTGIYFFDPAGTTAEKISLSSHIKDDVSNIAAASGGKASLPVIGTVAGVVLADGTIDITDDIADPVNYNPRYTNILNGTVLVTLQPSGVELTEGPSADYVVDYHNGQFNFVNGALLPPGTAVDIDFKYNDVGFGGVGDGSNAVEMAELKNAIISSPDMLGTPTQSIGEFYSSFIGGLGIDRNEAISNSETRDFILQQLMKRQDEVSGVSLDEEMANMIKYENSYQASARFISKIDQMLEILMNL